MARTIVSLAAAIPLLMAPWVAVPAMGDGAGSPMASSVAPAPSAGQQPNAPASPASTPATSPAVSPNLAQSSSPGTGTGTLPSGGSSMPSANTLQAPPQQTADILRLQLTQQADPRLQNAAGASLDARMAQTVSLRGWDRIEELRARQVTRVQVNDDGIFIRMVQEIRLRAQQLDQAAAQPGGEARLTRAVARTFGTSEARIRAERGEHRLGLGELTIARALARATAGSDHPLTMRQIVALREEEGGWGRVFHRLHEEGLVDAKNLGQVVRHARAATEATLAAKGAPAARAEARGRAEGATGAEARAKASSRAQVGTTVTRAQAEVRDGSGHRLAEAGARRTTPRTRDDRVRAPEPARTRPVAITTASGRTEFLDAGRPRGRGAVHSAQPADVKSASADWAPVTATGHGRSGAAVAITSGGNGTQAGGHAAVIPTGDGRGGHGH